MKRRDFTKLVVAASLLPPSGYARSAILTSGNKNPVKPVHFIYEKSYAAPASGTLPAFDDFEKVHVIDGDVTKVWYNELHYLWQKKSILTAGLTRDSGFFVLKTLARDYDYTVSHQVQAENTQFISWLLVPA